MPGKLLEPTCICLDTCTWIYLANGTEPADLLEDILVLLDHDNFNIIVPQMVVNEWEDGKRKGAVKNIVEYTFKELLVAVDKASKIAEKVKYVDSLDKIINTTPHNPIKEDFKIIKQRVIENKEKTLLEVDHNIALIDRIFSHESTVIIPEKGKILEEAGRIALAKKAPLRDKNGFADAVIVLCFLNYVQTKKINHASFISYNTKDFCEKDGSGKFALHKDLTPLFQASNVKFHHYLVSALNEIEAYPEYDRIKEYIENNLNEFFEYYCNECDGYDGFGNEIDFLPPEEIVNENLYHYDNQQASLFPNNEIIIKHTNLPTTIQIGYCNHCSAQYIRCQHCENIIHIEAYANDAIFTCNCGIRYKRESEFDRKGQEYVNWSIIDDRTKVCEGCGEEFIDKIGTGMCQKCEDEYNDK